VDCALWDLEAKQAAVSVAEVLGLAPKPITTAFTVSLGDPDAMAAEAARNAHRPLLKIKLGTADDEARMRAVRGAAPQSRIIVDANEGWTEDNLEHHLRIARELEMALIEQPLPAG